MRVMVWTLSVLLFSSGVSAQTLLTPPIQRRPTPIRDAVVTYRASHQASQAAATPSAFQNPKPCGSTCRSVVIGAIIGGAIGGAFGTWVGYQSADSHAEVAKVGFVMGGLGAAAGAFTGLVVASP